MKEKVYDSMLVHVYSQPNHDGEIKLDIRGHMQVMAAAMLYKSGEARNFFIAGGNIFGDDKPSASDVYKRELTKRGVPEEQIHIRPEAVETGQHSLMNRKLETGIVWAQLRQELTQIELGLSTR